MINPWHLMPFRWSIAFVVSLCTAVGIAMTFEEASGCERCGAQAAAFLQFGFEFASPQTEQPHRRADTRLRPDRHHILAYLLAVLAQLLSLALSPSLHDLVELGPKLLDGDASVIARLAGGVLGNREHPFGLVHGVLARGILPRVEVRQGVANPEKLAAVWQPPGGLEPSQEPVDTVNDVAARGCPSDRAQGHVAT